MPTDFDRLILDEAPGGVVVTTRKGEVVHWSRGAQLIFGYSAEETVGRALAELIELDDQRGARDKVMYELNDKGINDYECLRRRKDGAPVISMPPARLFIMPQARSNISCSAKRISPI